ncbi:MAG: hypothetical protein HZY73_01045 [Micropruina sp.]|nr:MAG: hypothetical protein HZY73_01045 [Micropruina sp.]
MSSATLTRIRTPRIPWSTARATAQPEAWLTIIRMALIVYVALSVLSLVLDAGQWYAHPAEPVMLLTSSAVMLGYGWRPGLAFLSSVPLLALTLVVGNWGQDLNLVYIGGCIVVATLPARRAVAAQAVLVTYQAVRVFRAADPGYAVIVPLAWGISVGAGYAARRLLAAQRRHRAEAELLARQRGQIRKRERDRLADETSAVVAGCLHRASDELARCAAAVGVPRLVEGLDRIEESCREALAELRTLVGFLRDTRTGGAPATIGAPRVAAPWLRPALLAGLVALIGPLWAPSLITGDAEREPIAHLALGLAVVAMGIGLWRGRLGIALGALSLLTSLGQQMMFEMAGVVLLVLSVAVAFQFRGRALMLGLAGLLVWPVARYAPGPDGVAMIVSGACVVALGAASGLAARNLVDETRRHAATHARLAAERDAILAAERARWARDLHDAVGHQLSVATLQLMGHADARDEAELRDVLGRVSVALDATALELRGLVGEVAADAAPGEPVATVAATLAETLRAHGFVPRVEVWPSGEPGPASARTVVRVLQEAVTNVLRYAAPGGRCDLLVRPEGRLLRVRVTSALAARTRRSELSSGWGLRGLAERVDLVGGTFRAAPSGNQWVVEAVLPG